MLAIALTAAVAGRLGGARWLAVHRLATPSFAAAWLHGVLAGTDTAALRSVYAISGMVVLGLIVTRHLSETATGPAPATMGGTRRHRPMTSRLRVVESGSLDMPSAAPPALAVAGDAGARLLAGPPASAGAESHAAHQRRLGPLLPSLRDPAELRASVSAAAVVGRGGGAFPLARKLDLAVRSPGAPIVVVNASEGEPASAKDATLLALRPHLVLDGAGAAAFAVGATDVVIYIHGARDGVQLRLAHALAEREPYGWPEGVSVHVVDAPDTYLAGESASLGSFLDGGAAVPARVGLSAGGVRRRWPPHGRLQRGDARPPRARGALRTIVVPGGRHG